MSRSIVVEDGNGFFVELLQPDMMPEPGGTRTANPRRSFIFGVDTIVTVADVEESAKFFRDVFGLTVTIDPSFHADPKRLEVFGMNGAQYPRQLWPGPIGRRN